MNMKSLLKELVKDPQIKALYNQGFDRSVVNRLIIESLMEEEDDDKTEPDIPGFKPEFNNMVKQIVGSDSKQEIEAKLSAAKEMLNSDDDLDKTTKKSLYNQMIQVAKNRLEKIGEDGKEITLKQLNDYFESNEWKEIEKFLLNVKKWFKSNPKAKKITLDDYNKAFKKKMFESNDRIISTSDDPKEKKDIISEIITIVQRFINRKIDSYKRDEFFKFFSEIEELKKSVETKYPIAVRVPEKEAEVNAIVRQHAQNLSQTAQRLLTHTPDDTKEKAKDQKPEYIARESFLEKWTPVGTAFDRYEELFGTTPFLKVQSEVLFDLKGALLKFVDGLKKASKPTGKKEETPERVQEQVGEVIEVQPEKQNKIFSLHKELIRETNALVKIIKQLNDDNMTTIGGSNIRKRARLKAKELMNLMGLALVELQAIKGEEREKLTFKEQQEMDEETELLRKSHQQILSNMTKMDRIARARPKEGENTRIDSKYITPVVKDTLAIIDGIEHMFPKSSPFGKKGNLGEIKIQVKGIARDIIDIVAKLKDFAKSDKTRTQNVEKLKEYIVNAMATIINSFDIDIEDEKLKSLLPKKARPNAPSYNDGAAELKDKIDDLIQKYGPSIAKALKDESIKSWEKVGNFLKSKLKTYFDNKIPAIIAGELRVVKPEHIKRMELITKFIKFIAKMKNKGILNENLRNFFKQLGVEKGNKEFGKQFGKQFTRDEIREIKDYLSKEQNYQDLLGVVKQALKQPSDSWLFDDFQLEPEDDFELEPEDDFELEPEDEFKPEPDDDSDKDATQPATDGKLTPFEEFKNNTPDEKQVLLSKGLGKVNSVKSLAKAIYRVVFGKEYKKSFLQRIKSFFTEQEENLSVIEKFEKMDKEFKERDYNFPWNDIYDNLVEIVTDKIDENSSLESIEKNIVKFINDTKDRNYKNEIYSKIRKLNNDKFIEHLSYYFENYPEYRSLLKQTQAEVEKFSDKDDDKDLGDSDLSTDNNGENEEDEEKTSSPDDGPKDFSDKAREIKAKDHYKLKDDTPDGKEEAKKKFEKAVPEIEVEEVEKLEGGKLKIFYNPGDDVDATELRIDEKNFIIANSVEEFYKYYESFNPEDWEDEETEQEIDSADVEQSPEEKLFAKVKEVIKVGEVWKQEGYKEKLIVKSVEKDIFSEPTEPVIKITFEYFDKRERKKVKQTLLIQNDEGLWNLNRQDGGKYEKIKDASSELYQESKNKRIERKLERIIEHYLNTGKL